MARRVMMRDRLAHVVAGLIAMFLFWAVATGVYLVVDLFRDGDPVEDYKAKRCAELAKELKSETRYVRGRCYVKGWGQR